MDVLPSDVKHRKVLETEGILNKMYKEAERGSYSANIRSMILKALGQASYLSNIAKNAQDYPPATFFSTIKELGSTLLNVNSLLEKL